MKPLKRELQAYLSPIILIVLLLSCKKDIPVDAKPEQFLISFGATTPLQQTAGYNIYLMSDDGTNVRLLTDSLRVGSSGTAFEFFVWSRNGSKIIYPSDSYSLVILNVDRIGLRKISLPSACSSRPDLSSDGSTFVFSGAYSDSIATIFGAIFLMASDGTNPVRLTRDSLDLSVSNPAFSPNGSRLAYMYQQNLYVMNSDGTSSRRLSTTMMAPLPRPFEWSPDGVRILFQSSPSSGQFQISVINADGTNEQNLSGTSTSDYFPAFSPNGQKIVFVSNYNQVCTMNADGSHRIGLTQDLGSYLSAGWSPDGMKIAYYFSADGVPPAVYVMNADGSGNKKLTGTEFNSIHGVSWVPSSSY